MDALWNVWSEEAWDFVGEAETLMWFLFLFAQGGVWLALQPPAWKLARAVSDGDSER